MFSLSLDSGQNRQAVFAQFTALCAGLRGVIGLTRLKIAVERVDFFPAFTLWQTLSHGRIF